MLHSLSLKCAFDRTMAASLTSEICALYRWMKAPPSPAGQAILDQVEHVVAAKDKRATCVGTPHDW